MQKLTPFLIVGGALAVLMIVCSLTASPVLHNTSDVVASQAMRDAWKTQGQAVNVIGQQNTTITIIAGILGVTVLGLLFVIGRFSAGGGRPAPPRASYAPAPPSFLSRGGGGPTGAVSLLDMRRNPREVVRRYSYEKKVELWRLLNVWLSIVSDELGYDTPATTKTNTNTLTVYEDNADIDIHWG